MFNPVLAKTQIHDIKDYKGPFPVIAMPKLDGFRCGITKPLPPNIDYKKGKYDVPDTVVGWSRNGKNTPSLFVQSVLREFYNQMGPGWDGELLAGANFQESAQVMQKGSKDDYFYFKYVIFDYAIDRPFRDRLSKANMAIGEFRNSQPVYGKFFHLVSSIYCEDMDQLIWAYDSLKTEEGIMIRVCSPEGYLHGKRDKNLIKVKEFMQDEAIIIGFEPERYGKNLKIVPEELWGQPKNRAGKLIVRGLENSPFEGLEFKVGSGLSHEQREEIYDNYHDNWDNRIITFKYLRGGTKTLPRHPVFLGFREDI